MQKGKQKSPWRATSRSRSQPLTPEGREKVTQINVCIGNKQMHDKHKDQGCPGISILSLFLLTSTSLHFARNDVTKSEKTKWRQRMYTMQSKCLFCDFFRSLRRDFSWNHINCKNNDQTWLFQIINICRPLGREEVWIFGLAASCSNNFLGTRQMLVHENTCTIPIVRRECHNQSSQPSASPLMWNHNVNIHVEDQRSYHFHFPQVRYS